MAEHLPTWSLLPLARVDRVRGPLTKWQQDGEHWIDVSIAKQVLLAYDGTKPAYATLVSSGEAGLGDPELDGTRVVETYLREPR